MIARKAAVPGSFDPLTYGHIDILARASKLFEEVVIVVAENTFKKCWFSIHERCEFAKKAIKPHPNVRVAVCDALLIDFCRNQGIHVLLRGIRTFSDYEYESSMSRLNRQHFPGLETLFLMASQGFTHINSNMVKEFARFGADVSSWVPPFVASALVKRAKEL